MEKYYKSKFTINDNDTCYCKVTNMVKKDEILGSDLYTVTGLILLIYHNKKWTLTDNYDLFIDEFEEITKDEFINKSLQLKSNKHYIESEYPNVSGKITYKRALRILSKLE